jgi:hypothetical protein
MRLSDHQPLRQLPNQVSRLPTTVPLNNTDPWITDVAFFSVLLAWALSNGLLAVAILSGGTSSTFSNSGSKQASYMMFILIFVAATSGIVRPSLSLSKRLEVTWTDPDSPDLCSDSSPRPCSFSSPSSPAIELLLFLTPSLFAHPVAWKGLSSALHTSSLLYYRISSLLFCRNLHVCRTLSWLFTKGAFVSSPAEQFPLTGPKAA